MTTFAIPTNSADLEDLLNDKSKMATIVAENQLGEVVKNYVNATRKYDAGLDEQIKIGTQQAMAEFLETAAKNGAKPPVDLTVDENPYKGTAKKSALYNKRSVGARIDGIFDDGGDFFRSIWHRANTFKDYAQIEAKLNKVREIQNAFSETIPADGGFLVPEVLRSEILRNSLEAGIVRPRARVIPMDSLRVPMPMVDETTHVGSVYGGFIGSWTEEGASLTQSQASFGRVVLEAKKLALYAEAPNELVQDAPAFQAFFDQGAGEALAWFEDLAFFQGTGVGEPLGYLKAASTVLYNAATSSQVAWSDVAGMYARMLPASLQRAVWVASPDVFPQLAAMTFGTGQFPALVQIGGGGNAFNMSLLGRPLVISEKNPALGTDGALSLVDFGFYLIGDRQTMTAMSSTDFKFDQDKTAFRLIERVDGRPWLNSAITPSNGSTNTLSPFVQLTGVHT